MAKLARTSGNVQRSRLHRSAIVYSQRFGWAVFPLRPREKIPLIPKTEGGRGCLDASTDIDLVDQWWTRRPDANVGIATGGPSGFWVLDVDPKSGGDDSLSDLLRGESFPPTVEALTGSHGRHILFHWDESLADVKQVAIAPGLDVRVTGGYIVGAPSTHPNGRQYEWEASSRPDELDPAPAPDWLLRRLIRHKHAARAGEASNVDDASQFELGRAFAEVGWLGRQIKPGVWAVMCPSQHHHSCGSPFDTSTVLFAPRSPGGPGWFHCSHRCEFSGSIEVLCCLKRAARAAG